MHEIIKESMKIEYSTVEWALFPKHNLLYQVIRRSEIINLGSLTTSTKIGGRSGGNNVCRHCHDVAKSVYP
jgi:hypothetical protein